MFHLFTGFSIFAEPGMRQEERKCCRPSGPKTELPWCLFGRFPQGLRPFVSPNEAEEGQIHGAAI